MFLEILKIFVHKTHAIGPSIQVSQDENGCGTEDQGGRMIFHLDRPRQWICKLLIQHTRMKVNMFDGVWLIYKWCRSPNKVE